MAIPASAKTIDQTMDPKDILDFGVTLTKEGVDIVPFPFLQASEAVASYTVALLPEAMAAGLRIKIDSGYATTLAGQMVTVWLEVDAAMQGAEPFTNGLTLGLEVTVTTTSTPPRRKQRTFAVKVQQQ